MDGLHDAKQDANNNNAGAITPLPTCLDGTVFNYIVKHTDNFALHWRRAVPQSGSFRWRE
jgi:hypothetical protein